MEPPPPPPPPHGSNPPGGGRSGGLPDGRYDIFVIPPHSSGSGFLYLPSLQTQRNSFLAGVFCTAATFFIYTTAVPVVKQWLFNTVNSGGGGVFMLICGVAVVAWAFGKTQNEWAQAGPSNGPSSGPGPGGQAGGGHTGFNNAGSYGQSGHPPNTHSSPPPNSPRPHSSWQRPPPQANTKANTTGAKSSWEKAREETRKREEERKRAEELKKRREELEKERQKQREKDALERLERERREKKEREDRERDRKEKEAAAAKEKERHRQAAEAGAKRPPMPTAKTENEDDSYSFRPYDRPRRPYKANSAASMYSESSNAPSESTVKPTAPPSARGPYSTKDPDKIIIKGVFSFNNAFMRTPISQLVSGQGNVTDGLILRITTEGLFIDDDVRGVPQREWDVKAWTMKLAEVWCPNLPTGNVSPRRKFSLGFGAHSRQEPSPSQTETSIFVNNLTKSCELDGMHVLRASIRDQEGKKYIFILSQSEGWKVAVGLQRLRRGSQVRALGVAGLPHNEAKAILESLGFA
ncbi:hypothetical protein H2202_007681 [Exophiala xenobiotica]|nr:hypothetical protein H2202_007681 [Exophiala xenobiotica]KAK5209603.1 hypothetical protein LTR41_005139 [Exophiala xenobiotica]KAK5418494.1 hypothetical protein LTR06_002244 [Exophiala xenobiotica]